jgi:hypothetical protein
MIGSSAIAAWIAQIVFWALILLGVGSGELGIKGAAAFVLLWVAAYIGLPFVSFGSLFLTPSVAVLDVVLVFLVFKGDVRLS